MSERTPCTTGVWRLCCMVRIFWCDWNLRSIKKDLGLWWQMHKCWGLVSFQKDKKQRIALSIPNRQIVFFFPAFSFCPSVLTVCPILIGSLVPIWIYSPVTFVLCPLQTLFFWISGHFCELWKACLLVCVPAFSVLCLGFHFDMHITC